MPASQKIIDLIQRFQDNFEDYKRSSYNEAQVRREFIDPFFRELGWDVDNVSNLSEAYKEVVHEDSIRIEGNIKAPDYSFRISGIRKYFVEAKKPSVNITTAIAPAYQLRRYGWSANLPVSILTDFEELVIYDCRFKPNEDDQAQVGRLKTYHYTEYVSKWEEIYEVFSKEAVLSGALDKFSAELPIRGTALVDTVFLSEIEMWRTNLARDIVKNNVGISQRDLNFIIQKTIDRIIFLRIGEARGLEPYHILGDAAKQSGVYSQLLFLFQRADDKYNSGLFHFKAEKHRHGPPDTFSLAIKISDSVLRSIISSLYYPISPYEFSVMPSDILGQVYERFLGKLVNIHTGGKIIVEDKPEVKKAGGVFYTPVHIVKDIITRTVGDLLAGKKPKDIDGSIPTRKFRVLDPSCGSGSFLIEVYQFLLDWHLNYYVNNNPAQLSKGKSAKLATSSAGGWILTNAEKKRILTQYIYGVDIDPQAVEVTKLSLALKMLEGENPEAKSNQIRLIQERILPDLENNIKCGNTLIASDLFDHIQIGLFDQEEQYRINTFDWDDEFRDIIDSGGFDCIVGNPPYGAYIGRFEIEYLNSTFQHQNYQLDSYILFIEKSYHLLRDGGRVGVIIPNTWLSNIKNDGIRKLILEGTQINSIQHYRYRVFPKVTVDTETVVLSKKNPTPDSKIYVRIWNKNRSHHDYVIPQERWSIKNGAAISIYETPELFDLSDRMSSLPKLDDLCNITQGLKPFQRGKGKPAQTQEIVDSKPYISSKKIDSSFSPLLRGSLIGRYEILWDNDYWIQYGDWLAEPRASAGHTFAQKIVIRQTGDSLIAALDENRFYIRDNLYSIIQKDPSINLKYILALLNSDLLNWYYRNIISSESGEALAQVKRGQLALLPIKYDQKEEGVVIALIDEIISHKKKLRSANNPYDLKIIANQITKLEKQKNAAINKIYGLSLSEERALADSDTRFN